MKLAARAVLYVGRQNETAPSGHRGPSLFERRVPESGYVETELAQREGQPVVNPAGTYSNLVTSAYGQKT